MCAQLLLIPLAYSTEIPFSKAINQAVEFTQLADLDEAVQLESQSYRQMAGILPNPSLFFEQEELDGSTLTSDSRETTFGLSVPLDFIWKRAAKVKAAKFQGNLALLRIENQRRQLARQVAILFVEYDANRLESDRHEAVHAALDRAKAVAEASVETGDSPLTLLQRVDLAIARHAFEENRLQTNLLAIRSRFFSLLGESEANPDIKSLPTLEKRFSTESQATETALQNRPDLRAAQTLFGWKQAEQKATRREGLPDVSLEAAQKEDNIGRDGYFLSLSVELPIFDRNQGKANLAAAESLRADVLYRQAIWKVEAEVRTAFLRWQALSNNWERLIENLGATSNAEALLTAAEASFEAGESNLLEYLNTVEAYLETAEQEIELQREYRLAAIELGHTTATLTLTE